ncbi:unnamed protein product [Didymodactylos carnosus]|uniref:Phosphotransferase n=1 Tax=Didymodactylos carnosus TaxID=1234261 RepID=A0A814BT53_9BILA|nr:unnamed protein product [Didymodactylos carnosus]CAF3709528.1 unnamed protein product [Didymodactylos carnosus]
MSHTNLSSTKSNQSCDIYSEKCKAPNWLQTCFPCFGPPLSLFSNVNGKLNISPQFKSQAGKEIVHRNDTFGGLLHDPLEEDITSILHTKIDLIPDDEYKELMNITSPFHINVETLIHVMQVMENSIKMGLDPTTQHKSDLKMIPTYVTTIATKREEGDILALDLGGTNFRTLLVKIRPQHDPVVISEAHIVPDSKKQNSQELFRFISDVLKLFMIRNKLDLNKKFILGFTFSFPCQQLALNRANFLYPTKGWGLQDLIDHDVVEKLQECLNEKQLNVRVTALINDTVGTLIACGYKVPSCKVGIILGTGTNACYFEDISKIQTITDTTVLPLEATQMIINTEWGALGDSGCLDFVVNEFDREVDKVSNNPGKQIFEKLIAGMYMGRLAAEVLAVLMNHGIILKAQRGHQESYRQYSPFWVLYNLQTSHISEIELDTGKTFANTRTVMNKLGLPQASDADCAIISYTCRLISRRAAMLTAAAIAVLMKRLRGSNKVCIGIDGSLYRYHPRFNMIIQRHLKTLAPVLLDYELHISSDGSGIGAAIVAITADQERQKLKKIALKPTVAC